MDSQIQTAILIQAASILNAEQASGLERQDILIVNQRIHTLSAPHTLFPPNQACQILDGTHMLVIPGLINAHTHSPENVLKATMPSLPTEMWGIPLYSDFLPWSPRLTYLSALWGAVEMLKNGTTAVLDHLWTVDGVSLPHFEAAMQAYHDVGIRATVAPFIEDQDLLITAGQKHGLSFPPHPYIERFNAWSPLEEQVALLEQFISTWHRAASGRLRCLPGPVGIQWCSPRLLSICLGIANRYETGIHLHALETEMQARVVQDLLGQGGIAYLAAQGLLRPTTSLAHAVWLEAGDLERLAESKAVVVHNPVSNLRLGSGRFPLAEALQRGVRVALGSDGAASNDTQNMWSALKLAGLLHNRPDMSYQHWPQAAALLKMVYQGGAAAIGQVGEVGELTPGKLADLVLLNLQSAPFLPLRDPLLHLIYGEVQSAVDTVIVAGKIVVRHARVTNVDENALRKELRALCRLEWPGYAAYLQREPATCQVMENFAQLGQLYRH